MELELSLEVWFILCSAGFLAGLIDAIAGGGGMLTVPALLTTGLPPHLALGTNKLAATFGSFTASLTFYKQKLFDPLFWKLSLIFTAIGAVIGTIAVYLVDSAFLDKALPIIIIFTAVYTLIAKHTVDSKLALPIKTTVVKVKQVIQGIILGFYDGFAGPGTGAFWTASSSALYKMNIMHSCGLARSTNFISNFFSLLAFLYLGSVDFVIGISMGLFIMLGAWVGARTAIKLGSKFIRPVFITVVVIMSTNLVYNAWG